MQLDYHEITAHCLWDTQKRYEAIRPLLLDPTYSLKHRSSEINLHSQTLRKYLKTFKQKGFDGLQDFREQPWNKGNTQIPEDIRSTIYELKNRSPDISVFEIQKYLANTLDVNLNYRTLQKWVEHIETGPLPNHLISRPESNYEKKVEAVKLRRKGLSVKTIAQWVGTSVSTVKRTLSKFKATKSLASLEAGHTEAHVPKQVFNFKNLNRVMRLQKKFPQTGSWRITEMLKKEGLYQNPFIK